MDNNKDIMPEQNAAEQPAEKQEMTSIERAKELFEYEMTEVLLNFRSEVSTMRGKAASGYVNREVPKAGVAYEAPDIAVAGIDYTEENTDIALDTDAVRADFAVSFDGAVPEIPVFTQQTAVTTEAPAFTAEVPDVPQVSIPEMQAAEVQTVTAEVPDIPVFRADALFAAPKAQTAAVSVAVPEAQIGASFALPSAEQGEAPVMNTDVPPVDAARFAVGAVSSADVAVENTAVPTVAIPEPAAVSLEQPALSIAEVSAPAVPAISVQTDAAFPAIDVPQTESVSLVYDEKKAPTVEIDVAVPDAALPTLSIGIPENRETAPVLYPEIPEKPDFSAYYAEITEAIKQEQ